MLLYEDIKFDCRLYNGYKPCVYGNECAGCPFYEPQSESGTGFQPVNQPVDQPAKEPQSPNNSQSSIQGQDAPATPRWRPALTRDAIAKLPHAPRILIIKTGALGDVLRTTTILHPIRRAFPDAHITWITAPAALPLLSANPHIDHLTAFPENQSAESIQSTPSISSTQSISSIQSIPPPLHDQKFDLSICLEKEGYPLQFAAIANAEHRTGYSPTPWNTAAIANEESKYMLLLGLSDELKFHLNKKSYPEIICEAVGLPYLRDPYILNLTETGKCTRAAAIEKIQQTAARQSSFTGRMPVPRPIVGLNTGCGAVFRTKQWTLEGWVATARALQREANATVLLLGGVAETELNRAIAQQVPGIIDTGTDNPLEDFFGIIDACDVVVTSDSLGMHVAIARGKYTVALFGSTSHHEIDLYDRGEKIITDFPCSPCYLKTCDKKPMCMEAMSANTVVAAVLRGLSSINHSGAINH